MLVREVLKIVSCKRFRCKTLSRIGFELYTSLLLIVCEYPQAAYYVNDENVGVGDEKNLSFIFRLTGERKLDVRHVSV